MKKMTLYHWSTHVVTEPRIKGICGYGFYLAKNKKYSRACGDMLHKVVVCPQNTLVFNDAEVKKNAFFNIDKQHYDNYISQGYDSLAWYKNGVLCEFIALVPEIIKSIEFLGSRISENKLFILKNNTNKGKNTMNTPQKVRINEAQLKQIVAESVKRILAENDFNEEDIEEANIKTYAKAAGNAFGSLFNRKNKGGRIGAAKDVFNNTVKYADTNELIGKIKEYIDLYNQQIDKEYQEKGWNPRYAEKYKIKSTTTIGKLLGLKDNKGNRPMGMMTKDALNLNKKIRKSGGNFE